MHQLYYDGGGDEIGLVAAAQTLQKQAAHRLPLDALLANRSTRDPYLTKPVSGPPGHPHALRVWLAGVTHEVSAKLREIEAQQATGEAINVYDQKYRESVRRRGGPNCSPRASRTPVVGHGQPITRPGDTQRLVPETELVSVYGLTRQGRLERLGYTGGNDATDNGIEGRQSPQLAPSQKLGRWLRFLGAGVGYSRRVRRLRGRGLVPHLARRPNHRLQRGANRPEQPKHARTAPALRAPSF